MEGVDSAVASFCLVEADVSVANVANGRVLGDAVYNELSAAPPPKVTEEAEAAGDER